MLLTATMKFHFVPFVALGLLFTILSSACGKDSDIDTTDLLGRWDIREAYRDGKSTDTMVGMYFEFSEDGQLTTNMTGADESYRFELSGDEIRQREGTIEADYKIESLLESELVITTSLQGKHFRMVLDQATN